jgi:hypothetical protein
MPLKPGKAGIGPNIKREMAHGKPQDQAVAIALSHARKTGADIPPNPKERHACGCQAPDKERMMHCPHCKAHYRYGAGHCPQCGGAWG